MTDEELRRKAAVAIRLALNASETGPVFDELRDCVDEIDEDGQNRLYSASEAWVTPFSTSRAGSTP